MPTELKPAPGGIPIVGEKVAEIRFRKDDPRVGPSMTVELTDEDHGTLKWVGVTPEDQGDGTVLLRLPFGQAMKKAAP